MLWLIVTILAYPSLRRLYTIVYVDFQSELRHWSLDQGIRAMLKRVHDIRGVTPCYRLIMA